MKTKKGQVRRQLLRKNSDQESQYQCNARNPFQIQFDGDAVSQIPQKDRSYIQLNDDMRLNPYPYEPSFEDRSCNMSHSTKPNIIHPKKITMNGNSYQKVATKIENQKLSKTIQDMKVICSSCFMSQLVPGNASKFFCYNCEKLSQCKPQYRFFKCGKCKGKVCYPWGYSEYIKCTKCNTINFVPTL